MIDGVGCDIVSIPRIMKAIKRWGDKFLYRVFTDKEIAAAASKNNIRYNYFAKRFAAKEAFAKALKTGIGEKCSFRDIEILNNSKGMPYCNILRKEINLIPHLSLSDDGEYALAFVILEKPK